MSPLKWASGLALIDRLGVTKELRVADGKVSVTLPERSAAILVPRNPQ
ncbi:MAG: hypothetical protein ACREBC_32580 [Pyrinomonadaceae bacterium]